MKLKKEELIDYFGLHIKNEMKDFVTCKRPSCIAPALPHAVAAVAVHYAAYYGSLYDL